MLTVCFAPCFYINSTLSTKTNDWRLKVDEQLHYRVKYTYFCSLHSGSSRLNSFLIVPSISAARESWNIRTHEGCKMQK